MNQYQVCKGDRLRTLQQICRQARGVETKVSDRQFTGCPTNWTTSYVALLPTAHGIPICSYRKTIKISAARNSDIAKTNFLPPAFVISLGNTVPPFPPVTFICTLTNFNPSFPLRASPRPCQSLLCLLNRPQEFQPRPQMQRRRLTLILSDS